MVLMEEICQEIKNVPDRAHIIRIMASQSARKVSSIKLPNGQHTQAGTGTLKELQTVHFPASDAKEMTWQRQGQSNLWTYTAHKENWKLSKRVILQSKIRWAINTFKPFKLAGTDGIVPALLQQGVNYLTTHLCQIFRACLARGYIPTASRQVNVTFIPKPRKANYMEAKTYCPISLSSFMQKTMEKLVDRFIRDEILGLGPLHRYEFAYQPRKSTETALHYVIVHMMKQWKTRLHLEPSWILRELLIAPYIT
jgi:hypothetical protein